MSFGRGSNAGAGGAGGEMDLAGAKSQQKIVNKISSQFFEPAHQSKCCTFITVLVPVPLYVNQLCCEGKCIIRFLTICRQNSIISFCFPVHGRQPHAFLDGVWVVRPKPSFLRAVRK